MQDKTRLRAVRSRMALVLLGRTFAEGDGPKKSEMLEKYGHAGGHLRDALLEALEHHDDWWKHVEVEFLHERHNRWWKRLSHRSRARWLLGQLWTCSDTLPSLYHSELTDRQADQDPELDRENF